MSGATLLASDYLTDGVDHGRTGWMKDEKVFTTANVQDMKLLWKIKLDSTPREMHNLFPPLIAERVTTPQGTREMAVVAGVSDDLFGIDVASGELMWRKHFDSTYRRTGGRGGDALCPGGQTAVPAMAQTSRRASTRSTRCRGTAGCGRSISRTARMSRRPRSSCRRNGKPYALNLVNGVIYTASAQGCGGVAELVLLVRSRDAQSEHVPAGRRRSVGPARRGGRRPRAPSTSAPATASSIRRRGASATRSSA